MNAVMYGAGNIGRGFITQLFSQSGYRTTFIDVVDSVVNNLNENGEYPLFITRDDEYEKTIVNNVCAVNGNDIRSVADVICNADIMATAVGVSILKYIAKPISEGVRARMNNNKGPLDVIVCENKIDANVYLHDLISEYLNDKEKEYFDSNFGFVEASIGRMVPATPEKIKEKYPLAVCVEPFCILPVDKNGFKGEIPLIQNLLPYAPFELYIERKLYMHNMSHAVCAYIGNLLGYEYIWQAASDVRIRYIVLAALNESAQALSAYHNTDIKPLLDHAFDLLVRYDNKLLADTVSRVGKDTIRKLSPLDRIPGAIKRCIQCGVSYYYICAGLAAALRFAPAGDESSKEIFSFTADKGVGAALEKYSNITDENVISIVEKMYKAFDANVDTSLDLIVKQKI